MANKKIVVALGRNAFSESFPKQQERVKLAAKAIADLVEEKYDVVITHSNGPQVGMIQTAMTEFSRLDPDRTVAPMSICSAMSQGYIGFDLQNAIRSELLSRGLYKPVSTIITQVRVDPFDRAFNAPSKVIGRLMTKEEAENEKKKGNYVEYEEGDEGYRRIIASPKPIDIYEIDAIKALVDAHQLVIAAGGGGIPVLEQRTGLKGASAVIEKDYTAAKLADMLDADALMILTSSDNLTIDVDGEVKELGTLTTKEAEDLIDKGYFDPITSLPKIDASLNFVLAKKGRKAIISNLAKAKDAIRGKIGTVIE
ncbi:carbamate kinase [Eubacterium sp. AF19-12LB]|jgi:carbamate kinase|uniref:carbamate kinase n=1 Tax=unclassified Eubacterium (in: firmicutes) TaxID=2624479 RepID=UPI0003373126|nr:carbamate kinase [Eubacterium sp. AF19-12LB]MCJ7966120.1 carbamate kinase [Lachnospiraceae bacterium NSJ-171]RHR36694.1 carbamate kinase [Eubacterium sp. AF19-12LB]CDA29763.1 carbamate kinase [Eubacterium sp. CAG:156]